jgi:hypothetical protein
MATSNATKIYTSLTDAIAAMPTTPEVSPNFGDGVRVQAAAVWGFEDAGLAATSIPSVNLTP